ncbi:hypothetical protein [Azospirillum humicireducens]|uniref:hypothetical protein n=1 Tax=Azospirillum humicireducens TaxID=1226968 RepID=UPI0011B1ECF7|nr:hypothetical protein [Azospirillum humicireducens]
MGIASALVEGFLTIGKIAQAVSSIKSGGLYKDELSGSIFTEEINSDKVIFVGKWTPQTAVSSGNFSVVAINTSHETTYNIGFPNDPNGNCISYQLKPLEKFTINEIHNGSYPASTNLSVCPGKIVGPFSAEQPNAAGVESAAISFALKDLKVGETVTVGALEVSLTTTGIMILAPFTILALAAYRWISSDGISVNSSSPKTPSNTRKNQELTERAYEFDLGFKERSVNIEKSGVTLSADITLSATQESYDYFIANNKYKSEPLEEDEIRYVKFLNNRNQ